MQHKVLIPMSVRLLQSSVDKKMILIQQEAVKAKSHNFAGDPTHCSISEHISQAKYSLHM